MAFIPSVGLDRKPEAHSGTRYCGFPTIDTRQNGAGAGAGASDAFDTRAPFILSGSVISGLGDAHFLVLVFIR